MLGLATGRIEARTGLAPLFCAIFAAAALSLVRIALAPGSWSAVLAASGLHGVALMMVSAVFSFWSVRLFPGRGTLGFTATLLSLAAAACWVRRWPGCWPRLKDRKSCSSPPPPRRSPRRSGSGLRRPRPRLPPVAGER